MPEWMPVQRSRAHEQVIQAIEEQIMSGALSVGDPLPPERDLAAKLQVSRAGVREAIRVLEGQGVLTSQVGSGAVAGTFVASATSEALTRLLRLHVGLSNFPAEDVVEARVLLERSSAASAATHASATGLAGIREQLEQMDAPGVTRTAFNSADTGFHVAIAEASGNRLVADMTIAIRGSLRSPILAAFHEVGEWEKLAAALQEQHHEIFDAIERGDAAAAADSVERHIRFSFEALPALRTAEG